MTVQNVVFRVVLPIAVVVLALVCTGGMVALRPKAERSAPAQAAALVEVLEVAPRDELARVRATGVTRPARQITLTPEVGGRIVEVSEQLVPGGRFAKGDVLARIDPRDYQLLVEQEQSRVRQSELDLQLENGRQEIARREWALLGNGRPAEESPLALRQPHLATSQQALAAARSGLDRARLNLERTVLRAPFDAVVIDENVDVGQVVGAATVVASLIGTDELWVRVSVPVEHLSAIALPDAAGQGGAPVRVSQRVGPEQIVRDGHIVRLLGELDPQTRTAQLLVAVEDPFGAAMPLLPGAYVDVEIEGRPLRGTYRVPRLALYGDSTVWTVGEGDLLRRNEVVVGWRDDDHVVVTSGLAPGDRIVVSPLSLPIEGMPVRTTAKGPDARSAVDRDADAETM